jgi:hypothetical protein
MLRSLQSRLTTSVVLATLGLILTAASVLAGDPAGPLPR